MMHMRPASIQAYDAQAVVTEDHVIVAAEISR
jgi:hypothetical protein